MEKITFIYCFRDRDLIRVKLSLDSLSNQKEKSFKVIFVDYGSKTEIADAVKKLVSEYSFARYVYADTRGMMWNRSHALNIAIRLCETPYVFTSDIDMIYKPGFVGLLNSISDPGKAIFFSTIYLPEGKLPGNEKNESGYKVSNDEALGLGMIPVEVLITMNGYDEIFCIYGKEDNDIGLRLKLAGIEVVFVSQIWMHHYYHTNSQTQSEEPPGWIMFLGNYLDYVSKELVRNKDFTWGEIYKTEDRKAFQLMNDLNTNFEYVVVRSRFFRFLLESKFRNSKSGQPIMFAFEDKMVEIYQQSKLFKVTKKVSDLLKKMHVPVKVISEYYNLFEDVTYARNEAVYFLLQNKHLIKDYAFVLKKNTFKIVVIKK